MATRTRKQTPAKKATPKKPAAPARKPPAKKALPGTAPVNTTTVVDLRRPLPIRRRVFVGPMGAVEQAAIRAALASAKAALPVPVRAWHGPTARLQDGTLLTHTPAHATTDQPPTFHAAIRCPHGAIHPYTIHTADELQQARQLTASCDQRTDTAPTLPAPNPKVRALGDALTAAADTQPIPVITPVAPADHETAREHP
ncbi:hypothetical protein AB0F30_17245, partial [Streptomyces sp. NPDC029006]|uniref:hypothetical protein n=1 Tax=Streptomyces sp. NPDC029006 TaxID=3155467 RepID=UPI0033F0F360